MLSLFTLGMLIALGAAYDGGSVNSGYTASYEHENPGYGPPGYGPQHSSHYGSSNSEQMPSSGNSYNYNSHNYYNDWLSPRGTSWGHPYRSYDWYYPMYNYQPHYYYYTMPVVYRTWYTPVVYDWYVDPWWAVNVYGMGSTIYYSSSTSWTYKSGFTFPCNPCRFLDP